MPPRSVGAPSSAAAMGILEKISEIEKEIARTQKNKGEGQPGGAQFCGRAGAAERGRSGDQAAQRARGRGRRTGPGPHAPG